MDQISDLTYLEKFFKNWKKEKNKIFRFLAQNCQFPKSENYQNFLKL